MKNKAGETESWHIDLKNKGAAGKGLGEKPTGIYHHIWHTDTQGGFRLLRFANAQEDIGLQKTLTNILPAVTLSLSDEEFGKLVAGKANAQRLFMSGKLKVKGDVMKATKMEPILKKAQGSKAKL